MARKNEIQNKKSNILIFCIVFLKNVLYYERISMEVISMLIEFRFKNYRSFRDEAVLSMEATGLSSFKN